MEHWRIHRSRAGSCSKLGAVIAVTAKLTFFCRTASLLLNQDGQHYVLFLFLYSCVFSPCHLSLKYVLMMINFGRVLPTEHSNMVFVLSQYNSSASLDCLRSSLSATKLHLYSISFMLPNQKKMSGGFKVHEGCFSTCSRLFYIFQTSLKFFPRSFLNPLINVLSLHAIWEYHCFCKGCRIVPTDPRNCKPILTTLWFVNLHQLRIETVSNGRSLSEIKALYRLVYHVINVFFVLCLLYILQAATKHSLHFQNNSTGQYERRWRAQRRRGWCSKYWC